MNQVLLQKMNNSDQYDRLRTGAGFLRMKEVFTGKKACISGLFMTAILSAVVFVCAFFAIGSAVIPEVNADPDVVRICIDPGHGGENLGADYNGYLEKDMTLIVAEAMREELAKYEGIEVFMTRTSDVDMSLEERVDYAAEVGADFFFCLHFNMSADHDMYGAECWVSAFDSKYARGMDFAKIEMRALTDLGLYDRGIKTRLNSKGTNYYGVLRMADEVDMPGIIIEHCHLDNYNDEEFYDHHDMLVKYGILDATCVAMYYGLRSDELGVDYSDMTYEETPVPTSVVRPDDTDPILESVVYGEPYEAEGGTWTDVEIKAHDDDCRMLYYSYSTDGGIHWSERYRWMDDEGELIGDAILTDTIHTTIPVSAERDMYVIFKVYNLYNLDSESAPYYMAKAPAPEEEDQGQPAEGISQTTDIQNGSDGGISAYSDISRYDEATEIERPDEEVKPDTAFIVIAVILAVCILLVLLILGYVVYDNHRSSGRRRRR